MILPTDYFRVLDLMTHITGITEIMVPVMTVAQGGSVDSGGHAGH